MNAQIGGTVKTAIYLAACALHNTAPEGEILRNADFRALFTVSKRHSIAALVCMALEKADLLSAMEPETAGAWRQESAKAVRNALLYDAERAKLYAFMEEKGIWYMPLKGLLLSPLYPQYGVRQMADNDILFDAAFQKDVRAYFEANGYNTFAYGKMNHDVYQKKPSLDFEMHVALVDKRLYAKEADFFAGICQHLSAVSPGKMERRFSAEDFYLFHVAHAHKHFASAGTGLRTLIDTYVYLREQEAAMDGGYIREQLERLELADFEKSLRTLSQSLFGQPQPVDAAALSPTERELLLYVAGSGTYGNLDNAIVNRIAKEGSGTMTAGAKAKYYLSRLFPGREFCRKVNPIFDKYPVLIPFLWVWRVIRTLIWYRKRIWAEIKKVFRMEQAKGAPM